MRKVLIISGAVLLVFLLVISVVVLLTSNGSGKSTATKFAEYLVVEKNADSAYELTTETFREYTSLDSLKSHVNRLKDSMSDVQSVKLESSVEEDRFGSKHIKEPTTNTFSLTSNGTAWTLVVETIEQDGVVGVQRYELRIKESQE